MKGGIMVIRKGAREEVLIMMSEKKIFFKENAL